MTTAAELRRALAAHNAKRFDVDARAAVLVPIIERAHGLELLFTKRPETLRAHPGQVSFPGGRAEPDDPSHIATALREANEELGLLPHSLEIIGQLDDFVTGTGFTVTPVVGLFKEEPVITPNAHEVEAWFWVSLGALRREAAWRHMELTRQGQQFRVWFFDDAPHVIWGATAAMTRQLLGLLPR